jgi:molecular chaperone DnaK (HSP70)
LVEAGLDKQDLQEILLVGGTARAPAVRSVARNVLGKEPVLAPRPDQAVVLGAAIIGGRLAGVLSSDAPYEGLLAEKVSPHTVGLAMEKGMTFPMISQNAALPAFARRVISTNHDGQKGLEVRVVIGKSRHTDQNVLLGSCQLTDLEEGPAGSAEVEILFEMSEPEGLTVAARDLTSGRAVREHFDLGGA